MGLRLLLCGIMVSQDYQHRVARMAFKIHAKLFSIGIIILLLTDVLVDVGVGGESRSPISGLLPLGLCSTARSLIQVAVQRVSAEKIIVRSTEDPHLIRRNGSKAPS